MAGGRLTRFCTYEHDKHDLWAQRQEEGLPDLHTY